MLALSCHSASCKNIVKTRPTSHGKGSSYLTYPSSLQARLSCSLSLSFTTAFDLFSNMIASSYSDWVEPLESEDREIDGKTMSLQYMETLKALGASPSTKFVFPAEFSKLMRPISDMMGEKEPRRHDKCGGVGFMHVESSSPILFCIVYFCDSRRGPPAEGFVSLDC